MSGASGEHLGSARCLGIICEVGEKINRRKKKKKKKKTRKKHGRGLERKIRFVKTATKENVNIRGLELLKSTWPGAP